MKVALTGANGEAIRALVEKAGLEVDSRAPDVVISYGGDGTLLGAERDWPGIPKLAIRQTGSAIKCPDHEDELMLERLARGEISQTVLMKLEGCAKSRRLLAINDIGLHHSMPTSGVRFRVWINEEPYSGEIVGDGLVVATPFGSTAYYRSITRSFFRSGIGLAFNNTTEPLDHLVMTEFDTLRLGVTRGPAVLVADNSLETVTLQEGDEARICKAAEWTIILGIDTLLCNRCRKRDGMPFNRLGGLMTL
jgi:NAD+ kinase